MKGKGSKLLGFSLLMLLVAMSFNVSAEPQPANDQQVSNSTQLKQADIEAFVRKGCPHCAKAKQFLDVLQREQPVLKISVRDVSEEPGALERLKQLALIQKINNVRIPAFQIGDQLIIGYTDETTSGSQIRYALAHKKTTAPKADDAAGSCEAQPVVPCAPGAQAEAKEEFAIDFLGSHLSLDSVGLPLFTVVMGLLDGFNPCSMWVLILMISLLAPMNNRPRMIAVAGTFVLVEGLAYFVFMAAWLNLFLLIGLSRISQIIIALIALLAGAINLKDYLKFGWGFSLSIPEAAKPQIYTRIRRILQAQNLTGAIIGAIVLALLVQVVEFMCTSGFPALYTRILTLKQIGEVGYYSYLLLYNVAYMFDDMVVLAIGVVTLSQHRLQEKEGRLLKLISGLVMIGLGFYLLLK